MQSVADQHRKQAEVFYCFCAGKLRFESYNPSSLELVPALSCCSSLQRIWKFNSQLQLPLTICTFTEGNKLTIKNRREEKATLLLKMCCILEINPSASGRQTDGSTDEHIKLACKRERESPSWKEKEKRKAYIHCLLWPCASDYPWSRTLTEYDWSPASRVKFEPKTEFKKRKERKKNTMCASFRKVCDEWSTCLYMH